MWSYYWFVLILPPLFNTSVSDSRLRWIVSSYLINSLLLSACSSEKIITVLFREFCREMQPTELNNPQIFSNKGSVQMKMYFRKWSASFKFRTAKVSSVRCQLCNLSVFNSCSCSEYWLLQNLICIVRKALNLGGWIKGHYILDPSL